jgi:hypothetical protein
MSIFGWAAIAQESVTFTLFVCYSYDDSLWWSGATPAVER